MGLLVTVCAWGYDLSNTTLFPVSAPGFNCKDGDYFKGTGTAFLMVPNNASIILDNVDLCGGSSGDNGYAIYLKGNATILLVGGTSKVMSGNDNCSAIYVPEGFTLTIMQMPGHPSAALEAKCHSISGWGAGIGASRDKSCGNIVIYDGYVTAVGGRYAAGIGGAYQTNCGNISIGKDVKSLTATRGTSAQCAIGKGYGTSVKAGTITIATRVLDADITAQTYTYTPWDGDLWNLGMDDDVVALNGTVIFGYCSGKQRVFVEDGATITLHDADIYVQHSDTKYDQSGITCLGNATIKLKGKNTIEAADSYAAIYVPKGSTLTIEADDNNNVDPYTCALYATGGESAPAIGAGSSDPAGNIVINGGYIDAKGGQSSPAIGSGASWQGTCGNITIATGAHMVKATKGTGSSYSIGRSTDASCGTVTIGGKVTGSITQSPYQYPSGVDLTTLTSNYTIQNGVTVYGTLDASKQPYKLSIADNAKVTFNNVKIVGIDKEYSSSTKWAGVTCLGGAEITLQGENYITSFDPYYPAIFVPQGSTLTIKGDGQLEAKPCKHLGGSLLDAAGIGGGSSINCGYINIEGGTIYATGGSYAAGIGGGRYGNCQDITISGGRVFATGGAYAPGIGGSENKACGKITIKNTVTRVVANAGYDYIYGNYAAHSIGKGDGSSATCGTITIGGQTYPDGITDHRFVYPAINWDGDLAKVNEGDVVAKNGTVITGTYDPKQAFTVTIAANATVYLKDAVMTPNQNMNYKWATLICEGNAKIVLQGKSVLSPFSGWYPDIYVPAGSTLTIEGDGELLADYNSANYVPVIGGQDASDCGNIVINGGIITANSWGTDVPAIGGKASRACGDITITKNVYKLTAARALDGGTPSATYCTIGQGQNGTCGTVKIGDTVYETGVHETPFVFEPNWTQLEKTINDAENFYYQLITDTKYAAIAAELLDAIRDARAVQLNIYVTVAVVDDAIAAIQAALKKAEDEAAKIPTAIINAENSKSVDGKYFHNGQLIIIRNGKAYNAIGAEVK